ncbi:MAG: tetratricopeptide repeat protein [Hyphomicrobium sp.]
MTRTPSHAQRPTARSARLGSVIATLTAALMLGACSQTADLLGSSKLAEAGDDAVTGAPAGATELQKATMYWGQEYSRKPSELKAGLNYARNLKAMGEKQKALSVLQQVSVLHDGDPELAGEYGRLALDLNQVGAASRLLAVADNPAKPDWRVISARGTVYAKQGDYKQAISAYERALTLSNNQPSVMNNLAMAHAMSGNATKAEEILREATKLEGATPKVQQNLALVLGLQGRYDEAKTSIAAARAPASEAQVLASDTDMLRRVVKVDAKAAPAPAIPEFATATIAAPAETPKQGAQHWQDPAMAASLAKLPLRQGVDDQAPTEPWETSVAANTTGPGATVAGQ